MHPKRNNRILRKQRGQGAAVLLLTILLAFLILYAGAAWTVRVQDQLKFARAINDMHAARAQYNSCLIGYKQESHARARSLVLAIQQTINESKNPAPSGREGFNKYQDRQLANLPEFTMEEARRAFEVNTLLSIVGNDLGPNPETPGTDEYLAAEYMRAKMQQSSSSAYMRSRIDFIKPVSEFGLPHDDRLSDWVYGVRVWVQVVSEARLYGGVKPVDPGTPTVRWQQQYGDVAPNWSSPLPAPPVIPVPDDPRCLRAGSQYYPNQCGTDRHLVFIEDLIADDGQRTARCECQSDAPPPPTNPLPGRGGLVYTPLDKLMEGPQQWKFAVGLKFEGSKIPPTPGMKPVHYYNEGWLMQRGRYSGQFNYEFWVRFAKPVTDPDGGPENQVPLDLDVCADESCLPPPGGCVTGYDTQWDSTGTNLITTITTTCGIFSESTVVGGPADQADYSGIIRDHTAYLNTLWENRPGGGAGEFRRPAGNNGNGQPVGSVPAGAPPRDTASNPIWTPVFQPSPQTQTGIDPTRLRTFADLQMHFDALHEESPRYLRIAR